MNLKKRGQRDLDTQVQGVSQDVPSNFVAPWFILSFLVKAFEQLHIFANTFSMIM